MGVHWDGELEAALRLRVLSCMEGTTPSLDERGWLGGSVRGRAPMWLEWCSGPQLVGDPSGIIHTPLGTLGICTVPCWALCLAAPCSCQRDPVDGSTPGFANFGKQLQKQEFGG